MRTSVQLHLLLLLVSPGLGLEDECRQATEELSPVHHLYAEDGLEVTKIAFSSCHLPEEMSSVSNFWSDVRYMTSPDVFLWLGDNMYQDGEDINAKRRAYNRVREERQYREEGPVSESKGKIPVMATWDDHDYGYNNAGSEYQCKAETQAEWANHFNIPASQPQHPDSPHYRPGVYNARMFLKPGQEREEGVHVIMLDARSARDPTYSSFGACRGSHTGILSQTQWSWLEEELDKKSEIKVIGSGIQASSSPV